MNVRSIVGGSGIVVAILAAALYATYPARSSDHQDTYNLATRTNTSADITDVFVFPSQTNKDNVVFVMDLSPLIPAGMGPSKFFDPNVMWQFKISHGDKAGAEDEVMQVGVTGTDANQTITLYGPGKPNEVGTNNTFIAPAGSFQYNVARGTQLANGVVAFAGPRADPFFFDLFQFFTFQGDRYYKTHANQSDPGFGKTNTTLTDTHGNPATAPTFNGFPAGTVSAPGGYPCSTAPPADALTDVAGGFNVLAFVLEVPKKLITSGYPSQAVHVWATASSVTGS